MTRILAVETATDACSAALYIDGSVSELFEHAPREHARLILPMVRELLSQAHLPVTSLDAVAFGRGPGSFTGVRVAAGVVQGIAFGAGLPVVPVSTLAALAQGVRREHGVFRVLAVLDARMEEVYWGAFADPGTGHMAPVGEELVCLPTAVPLPGEGEWCGAGSGWERYGTALRAQAGTRVTSVYQEHAPRALDVALLAADAYAAGRTVPPEQALPVYLRDRITKKA